MRKPPDLNFKLQNYEITNLCQSERKLMKRQKLPQAQTPQIETASREKLTAEFAFSIRMMAKHPKLLIKSQNCEKIIRSLKRNHVLYYLTQRLPK